MPKLVVEFTAPKGDTLELRGMLLTAQKCIHGVFETLEMIPVNSKDTKYRVKFRLDFDLPSQIWHHVASALTGVITHYASKEIEQTGVKLTDSWVEEERAGLFR